jgi:hypothetical protein
MMKFVPRDAETVWATWRYGIKRLPDRKVALSPVLMATLKDKRDFASPSLH